MNLPKIDYPIYNITIPSTKKVQRFRPFLVKEEKLLLMAKEENNPADVLSTVKQIVNNCSLDNNLDLDKLALFDLEYLFLKLRAFSIDNVLKLTYIDNEDNKKYEFSVNLDEIEIKFPEKIENNIPLTKNSGLIMKYPSAKLYDDKEFLSIEKNYMFELIIKCVDKYYQDDNIIELNNYSKEEISNFIDNLSIKTFEKIQEFLINVPKLYHCIEYKNSLGNDRKIELSSLNDFFM